MSETSFQYIGEHPKAMAGDILFPKKKAVVVDNGQLAKMLRERKDFKEVTKEETKEVPNVKVEKSNHDLEDSKARTPKGDAKQS